MRRRPSPARTDSPADTSAGTSDTDTSDTAAPAA